MCIYTHAILKTLLNCELQLKMIITRYWNWCKQLVLFKVRFVGKTGWKEACWPTRERDSIEWSVAVTECYPSLPTHALGLHMYWVLEWSLVQGAAGRVSQLDSILALSVSDISNDIELFCLDASITRMKTAALHSSSCVPKNIQRFVTSRYYI